MTITMTRAAKRLSDAKSVPRGKSKRTFQFDGDSVTTEFELPAGWNVEMVFSNRLFMSEGDAEDYTIEYNGDKYSVVFAVAPAAVKVAIRAERKV